MDEYLLHNIKRLTERVEGGKASAIIIDGGVGEGKTTLAVQIADEIEGKPINFEEQIAMGGTDFARKLGECYRKKHKVIIYDEAGDFNRRSALTKLNATLNRIFETFRAFKIVVILVLPSFYVLDNSMFLKGVPRFLLHVQSRTHNRGKYKAYCISKALVIKSKMEKAIIPTRCYGAVPFDLDGWFYDLPEERRKELDLFSTRGKLLDLEKSSVKMDGLVSQKELCEKYGYTPGNISIIIKKYKLSPSRQIGRTKYYNRDLIEEIIENKKFNRSG